MFWSDIRQLKEALNVSIKRLNERPMELEPTHSFQYEADDQQHPQISKISYSDFKKKLQSELVNTVKLRKKIENESISIPTWRNKPVVASSTVSQKQEIAELQQQRQRIIDEVASQSKSEFRDETELKDMDLSIPTAIQKSPTESHQNLLHSSIQKSIDHSQYSIEGIVKLANIQENHFKTEDGLMMKHVSLHNSHFLRANYDTLSEVLQIQLQLADTITRLERSVHVRDLILTRASEYPSRDRRFGRKENRIFEGDSGSDSYISDESIERDYTMRRYAQVRKTMEDSVDEDSDADLLVESNMNEPATLPSSDVKAKDALSSPTTVVSIEPHSTNVKQVRFHESDYPTPLIARNLSFGDHSEDDFDSDSVLDLSFLRESQMSFSDLNNESFVNEFESFRQELRQSQNVCPSEDEAPKNRSDNDEDEINTVSSEDPIVTSTPDTNVFEDEDIVDLNEMKKAICLQIQEENLRYFLDKKTSRKCVIEKLRAKLGKVEGKLKQI